MEDHTVIDVLKDLLAAEQQSLAPRLFESTMFVSRLDAGAYEVVCSSAQASREHCGALTELILDLGGQPAPRLADSSTANLHYLELHHALPRLVVDQQSLERKYANAAPRVAGEPRASDLVNHILERRRQDLVRLQSSAARPEPALRA